ncbi:MAG: META domain-containing protein [Chloroflexi bacterium]|nr:META domain-containing protein [Chloroflexota bacterium]
MNTFLRLTVVTVALAGCGLLNAGSSAPGIAGRTFLSTGVTVGGAPHALVNGTQIRLSFTADGSFGAQAGCNIMGGTYRLDGGILTIQGGGMTEMGCDPARHDQDDWLFEILGSRPTLALNGNNLVLTAGDTVITLVDREVAEPDLVLVGPTWTVTSVITGDAVSSIPAGVVASLTFDAAGGVTFNTGCNSGGGRYTIEGSTIRFSDLVTTDIACGGAAGAMEATVLGILNGAPTFAIDASQLSLRVGSGGIDLTGA